MAERGIRLGIVKPLAVACILNTDGRHPQKVVTDQASVLHKLQFSVVSFISKSFNRHKTRITHTGFIGHSTMESCPQSKMSRSEGAIRRTTFTYTPSPSTPRPNDHLAHILQSCHKLTHFSTWKIELVGNSILLQPGSLTAQVLTMPYMWL